MSWLRDALDVIQLKPRFLFGIFLVGLLLVVLPGAAANVLGVTALRDQIRPWIAIATLAAFAFWLVQLWPIASGWWQRRQHQKAIIARLDSLSEDERALLAYCLARNRSTLLLEANERWFNAATALCQKGLMQKATGVIDACAWPHTIRDFVWAELQRRGGDFVPAEGTRAELLEERFASLDKIADGKPEDPYWTP